MTEIRTWNRNETILPRKRQNGWNRNCHGVSFLTYLVMLHHLNGCMTNNRFAKDVVIAYCPSTVFAWKTSKYLSG
jgi:hypothetical protein